VILSLKLQRLNSDVGTTGKREVVSMLN